MSSELWPTCVKHFIHVCALFRVSLDELFVRTKIHSSWWLHWKINSQNKTLQHFSILWHVRHGILMPVVMRQPKMPFFPISSACLYSCLPLLQTKPYFAFSAADLNEEKIKILHQWHILFSIPDLNDFNSLSGCLCRSLSNDLLFFPEATRLPLQPNESSSYCGRTPLVQQGFWDENRTSIGNLSWCHVEMWGAQKNWKGWCIIIGSNLSAQERASAETEVRWVGFAVNDLQSWIVRLWVFLPVNCSLVCSFLSW